jgi:hypothetical protein
VLTKSLRQLVVEKVRIRVDGREGPKSQVICLCVCQTSIICILSPPLRHQRIFVGKANRSLKVDTSIEGTKRKTKRFVRRLSSDLGRFKFSFAVHSVLTKFRLFFLLISYLIARSSTIEYNTSSITPTDTIVATPSKDGAVDKMRMKLHLVNEAMKDKKNRLHVISASQLDDDIVIEENGWNLENEEFESEFGQLDINEDSDDADLQQKVKRLERRQKRAEKAHGARLDHLKQELEKKREESEKEAKQLNGVRSAL